MPKLEFEAVVSSGLGRYSRLSFPNTKICPSLPAAWDRAMCPGSLNAQITGYPDDFDALGAGYGVQKLDNKSFAAEATVPAELIENNSLRPNASLPDKGDAQIWSCEVSVEGTSTTFNAWAVRRIGSAYSNIIELMSHDKLREKYGLTDGTRVKLTLKSQTK